MTLDEKSGRTMLGYYLQLTLWTLFLAVVTFLAAGTLAYPGGWAMIVLFGGGGVVMVAWLSRRSPQLLRERMSPPIQKHQERWDRIWLSLGATYAVKENLELDFGYTYVKAVTAAINEPGAGNGVFVGEAAGHSHLFGFGVSGKF